MRKTTEIDLKTRLLSRIRQLDKQQLSAFCSYVNLHGASFYSVRDKLMYQTGGFDYWEIVGVEQMIKDFAPGYTGTPEDFFESLDEKKEFVLHMCEAGGMSRTSCYQRFKMFNFKRWEIIGLANLLDRFCEDHA